MGEVWQAHDLLTQATVAVKILLSSVADAPAAELRFQREIEAMARLHHPRVVPVLDVGSDPRVGLYFVMTLQYGQPLHEMTPRWNHWNPLWSIADQILETLAFAHARGVIHRDIKPDNILVEANGQAVLLDFGVARLKDRARSGTSAYDMLGTVDYAAPEQATGKRRRIGPWTDIYSFALVLYEAICGRLAFWASSPVQSLMMRLERPCPPLDPRPGFSTPKGLSDILQRMTHPDPFKRFTHAAAAREALVSTLDDTYEILNPTQPDEHSENLNAQNRMQDLTDDEINLLRGQRSSHLERAESLSFLPMEPPLRPPKLIGQGKLFVQLQKGLERWLKKPNAGALILHGAPGSGKSRVVEELLAPYFASGKLNGHWHRWASMHNMRSIALSIASALGLPTTSAEEQVNWWLESHGASKAESVSITHWATTPAGSKDEQSGRILDFLKICCGQKPYVLFLDGLEQLETSVLVLLQKIRRSKLPIILILTVRKVPEPKPGSWLERICRKLPPLDDSALKRMMADLAILEDRHRLPIIYTSEGNPRRMINALKELRSRGLLAPYYPRWVQIPPEWIPKQG